MFSIVDDVQVKKWNIVDLGLQQTWFRTEQMSSTVKTWCPSRSKKSRRLMCRSWNSMQKGSLCLNQPLRGTSVFVTFLDSQSRCNLGTYGHDFATFLVTLDRERGGRERVKCIGMEDMFYKEKHLQE